MSEKDELRTKNEMPFRMSYGFKNGASMASGVGQVRPGSD